jgi:hypothetical protein
MIVAVDFWVCRGYIRKILWCELCILVIKGTIVMNLKGDYYFVEKNRFTLKGIIGLLALTILLLSCNQINDGQSNGLDTMNEYHGGHDIPPPPPPMPFQELECRRMRVNHFGNMITFQAKLFSDRLIDLEGGYLQTYMVEARNHKKTDSFYFALPQHLSRYWQDVRLINSQSSFNIGYYSKDEFYTLYTVYLGDSLNRGSIYMETPERIKYRDSLNSAFKNNGE